METTEALRAEQLMVADLLRAEIWRTRNRLRENENLSQPCPPGSATTTRHRGSSAVRSAIPVANIRSWE